MNMKDIKERESERKRKRNRERRIREEREELTKGCNEAVENQIKSTVGGKAGITG